MFLLLEVMKPPTSSAMDHIPELNLYNFEENEFADSKYVLTSPRSLEACDMLNVKVSQHEPWSVCGYSSRHLPYCSLFPAMIYFTVGPFSR